MARDDTVNKTLTEEGLILDENSGISKEDQQEIITEIEKIARESKIKVTSDVFNVKALKNGLLFPMIVNIAAVLLLAGGIVTLYSLFQYNESQLVAEEKIDTIAEGKLIKELKKQSEAKLSEKEKEITNIQDKLANINKEREDLLANMDSKVKEKETVLRQALESELAAERQRLKDSGISEAEITKRIAALGSQKEAAFNQQLDTFRKEAEAEKKKLENNLSVLKQELDKNLTKVNQEKQLIAAEYQKSEKELRSQLEEKTKALEAANKTSAAQLTQTETELSAAQSSLKKIAEQKEKEELVQNQILGFYNSVKQNIVNKEFDRAITNLDTIKNYLNNETIVVLPGVLKRRDVEFFVVDSLKSMVESEMNKDDVDTASLIASANLITDLKTKVLTADQEYGRGNIEKAEKLYTESLNLLPELSRSHTYFIKKRETADNEKQKVLNDALARAAGALELKDYTAALNYYTKALAYLPVTSQAADSLVTNIKTAGSKLVLKELNEKETQNAAQLLQKAQGFFQAGQYNESIVSYIDLITRYPNSSQLEPALSGIRRAVDSKDRLALEKNTTLESSMNEGIKNLNATIQTKIAEINALQEEKKTLMSENQSLRSKISELEKQKATATATPAPAAGKIQVDAEQLQKLKEYEAITNAYNKLKYMYSEYALREDEIMGKAGSEGMLEAKVYLDRFLASQEVEQLFPGLWERIKKYDNAFEKVGRDVTLQEISDIIYDLASLDTKEERLAYLDNEITKNKPDTVLTSFFQEVKGLIK